MIMCQYRTLRCSIKNTCEYMGSYRTLFCFDLPTQSSLYIGIMKVWGFWSKLSLQNQLDIYFLTLWEHWLGIAKPKNVFRSTTINLCIIFLWNFKISYLTDFSTDWLSDWLMPSDKRNSITAKAMGLISSLFNVASSRDMPFHQPLQLQCLHHRSTKAYLCSLFVIPFPTTA